MKKEVLMFALAFAATACSALTLDPGETLDWDDAAPAAGEEIVASGGTIVFDSNATVRNRIRLGGEVRVVVNNGASVRFARTLLKESPSGRLLLPCSVSFGSDTDSSFAFLPENSIAFADGATDAQLRLAGYVSMLVLPDKWSDSIVHACDNSAYLVFYGANMVTDAAYTVSSGNTVRMTSPTNFAANTVITVDKGSAFQDRPMKFNPETCAGEGIDYDTTTVASNKVMLAGGTLMINAGSTHNYWGDILGSGRISVERQFPSDRSRNVFHYFCGDLSQLDAQSELAVAQLREINNLMNQGARISTDFAGTVKLNYDTPNWIDANGISCISKDIVSFGFSVPGGSGETNEIWHVGALQGGSFIGTMGGNGGARLQFSAKQHIHVGTISKNLAVFATGLSAEANTDDLTVDNVADNTILYVKNGIRLHFGSVGNGVKLRFMENPVSSNVVEIGSGTIKEISFVGNHLAKPVYLNGGAVEKVVGTGTLVVSGDNVRLGEVDATVNVQVRSGSVQFGTGIDLENVLGSRPAVWLDASEVEKMTGVYNSGWAATDEGKLVLGANPAVMFNGSLTATYTNGFPLVEKWFDKRPGQTWTYGWQDRCVNYSSTLYPLVYPYLVPNGLNGRAYMSFGSHGTEDLPEKFGRGRADDKENFRRERRRMPLMHDMVNGNPSGNGINACATILVFGSQHGGGRAIVGGYEGNDRWKSAGKVTSINPTCGGNYLRGGEGYGAENPIFANDSTKAVWIDGESVDPTTTGLNGSWQIISVTNNAAFWRSLGECSMEEDSSGSGGQNYAEIISFTNAITSAERETVENYLAMKWGLTSVLKAKCSVTVSRGATVRGAIANVSGEGTWELDLPESRVTLNGTFAGAVSGAGSVAVPDWTKLPGFSESFCGSAIVTAQELSFGYANGEISPVLELSNADLTFPDVATVQIASDGANVYSGRYLLVSGKSLQGLSNCALEHDFDSSVKVRLERKGNALYLRVFNSTAIIVR